MEIDPKINTRLYEFVSNIQIKTIAHYAEHFPMLTPPEIIVKVCSKYYKIVTHFRASNNRNVYCFVSKATGDIYKAAGWAAPAKHVRGNIFDDNYSWGKGVELAGGKYLK